MEIEMTVQNKILLKERQTFYHIESIFLYLSQQIEVG